MNTADNLTQVLSGQIDCLQELLDTLENEHAVLIGRDSAAIETLAARKQTIAERMGRLETRRLALMTDEPDAETLELWATVTDFGKRCHQLNEINGGIAELGRRRMERCMELLQGMEPDSGVYNPDGGRERPGTAGRVVTV